MSGKRGWEKYAINLLLVQYGNLAFSKMVLLGLIDMCARYDEIMILEFDCFCPVKL